MVAVAPTVWYYGTTWPCPSCYVLVTYLGGFSHCVVVKLAVKLPLEKKIVGLLEMAS